MTRRPTILAYYFPNWHLDPRNEDWFGKGFTEWTLLRDARPRFEGHRQPRVPEGGEFDEADPAFAAEQIALAAEHGVDGFLVDYYWYDDGPYLETALRKGLLGAPNRDDIVFALMWANHDLVDIFPASSPDTVPRTLKRGALDRSAFEEFAHHVIDEYFQRPNYFTVDGKPWLSIYEIGSLIAGLGGVQQTADALAWFRDEAVRSGLPGIHLDAVIWGFGVLPTAVTVGDPLALVSSLAFDSATSYVWIHHIDVDDHAFPRGDWSRVRHEVFAEYEKATADLTVPFHSNVTVGWDSSPRTRQGTAFPAGGYPFLPTWDATPADFEEALRLAKSFEERHGPETGSVITINAWNEWTEGSALLPDTVNGLGFLEAVKRVFPISRASQ
jgi:hypothetical protein